MAFNAMKHYMGQYIFKPINFLTWLTIFHDLSPLLLILFTTQVFLNLFHLSQSPVVNLKALQILRALHILQVSPCAWSACRINVS